MPISVLTMKMPPIVTSSVTIRSGQPESSAMLPASNVRISRFQAASTKPVPSFASGVERNAEDRNHHRRQQHDRQRDDRQPADDRDRPGREGVFKLVAEPIAPSGSALHGGNLAEGRRTITVRRQFTGGGHAPIADIARNGPPLSLPRCHVIPVLLTKPLNQRLLFVRRANGQQGHNRRAARLARAGSFCECEVPSRPGLVRLGGRLAGVFGGLLQSLASRSGSFLAVLTGCGNFDSRRNSE